MCKDGPEVNGGWSTWKCRYMTLSSLSKSMSWGRASI